MQFETDSIYQSVNHHSLSVKWLAMDWMAGVQSWVEALGFFF